MSAVGANIGLRACFTCNFFLFVKSFILYVTIGIIMVDHREMSLSKQHAGGFLVCYGMWTIQVALTTGGLSATAATCIHT